MKNINGIHCYIDITGEMKYEIITDNEKIIAEIEDIDDLQINSIE